VRILFSFVAKEHADHAGRHLQHKHIQGKKPEIPGKTQDNWEFYGLPEKVPWML
jgi:hypothetical protein